MRLLRKCMFPESNGGKSKSQQLSPPKFKYFSDQNGPKGRRHENEF